MKKQGILPEQEPPNFDGSLMFYWESFWELNTTRHELSSIPWVAIDSYCKRWGIDSPDEFDSFLYFIRGLDSTYLGVKHKEIETKRNMDHSKRKR